MNFGQGKVIEFYSRLRVGTLARVMAVMASYPETPCTDAVN